MTTLTFHEKATSLKSLLCSHLQSQKYLIFFKLSEEENTRSQNYPRSCTASVQRLCFLYDLISP